MSTLYKAKRDRSPAQLKARGTGRRFYSPLDMAIIKHDVAVKNSEIKRGERKDLPNNYIAVCGCGVTGCFIHGQFETVPKEFRR